MQKVLVNIIEKDGSLKHFDTNLSNFIHQNYKDYSPNGVIFIAKPEHYLNRKHFFGVKSLAYIMNAKNSVDIDDALDLMLASLIIKDHKLLV